MRTIAMIAAAGMFVGAVSAAQAQGGMERPPTEAPEILDPNPKSDHGCLRPDVAKSMAAMNAAMAGARKSGKPVAEVTESQKSIAGCTYYRVGFKSTVSVSDNEFAGVTSTISGHGSVTFGLAKDNAMAGYDFTSGVQDLTAPIYWDPGSAKITRPGCIVTAVQLPYTLYAFWLGVTNSPDLKVGVRISPAGSDAHPIQTRCKDPLGRWHDLVPSRESIHSPAWTVLHGEGKLKRRESADQKALGKYATGLGTRAGASAAPPKVSSPMGDMDPVKMQAVADYVQKHPDASPEDIMKQLNGAMPGMNEQLAAAQDNFMFTKPGECVAASDVLARCTIVDKAVVLKDRRGYGTLKTISMTTVVTIAKLPPRS